MRPLRRLSFGSAPSSHRYSSAGPAAATSVVPSGVKARRATPPCGTASAKAGSARGANPSGTASRGSVLGATARGGAANGTASRGATAAGGTSSDTETDTAPGMGTGTDTASDTGTASCGVEAAAERAQASNSSARRTSIRAAKSGLIRPSSSGVSVPACSGQGGAASCISTLSAWAVVPRPNGLTPSRARYTTAPMAKRSPIGASWPCRRSGATYSNCRSFSLCDAGAKENEASGWIGGAKSVNTARPSSARITLAGLMFRCTRPARVYARYASSRSAASRAARCQDRAPRSAR